MVEATTIDAIGKLSVEVVAIISLAGSLYFQAKASRDQAKEMKNLAKAISGYVDDSVEKNKKMAEAVAEIKAMTLNNVKLVQQHHVWAQKFSKIFHQKA